tara:strand:+ start:422 stop:619 length:198 start_codon:yes stop_codon:yes gene_type:complete
MKLAITKNDTQSDKIKKYVKCLKRNLAVMSISKFKKDYKEEIKDVKRQLSNPELWYKVYVTEIIK